MFRLSDSGKTYGIANITDSTVKCKGILIGDGGNGEINMNGNVLLSLFKHGLYVYIPKRDRK